MQQQEAVDADVRRHSSMLTQVSPLLPVRCAHGTAVQAQDRCHRIGQTKNVAVYRLLTKGSVEIEMMEKQISKKKLERLSIVGGDYRKAGRRSRGEMTTDELRLLLQDDVHNLQRMSSLEVRGAFRTGINSDRSNGQGESGRRCWGTKGHTAVPDERVPRGIIRLLCCRCRRRTSRRTSWR